MPEKHHVRYGDTIIEFELERKNVKNVNLNIKPDLTIKVSAHNKVPESFICQFVHKKAPWILKHIGQFKEIQPKKKSKREYVSGETYKYLGKQYRLRVRKCGEQEKEHVKYLRGFIYLFVNDPDDTKRKQKLLNDWFRKRADVIFHQSLDKMYGLVKKYGIPKPKLQMRLMKARWGSCLVDQQTIILNSELIKAPKYCIDYVVLHELIHFKYNNHGDPFYTMLYALMPDWEKRKAILDEEVVRDL